MKNKRPIKKFITRVIIIVVFVCLIVSFLNRSKTEVEISQEILDNIEYKSVCILNDESISDKIVHKNSISFINIEFLKDIEIIDYYRDDEIGRIQFFGDSGNKYNLVEMLYNENKVIVNDEIYDVDDTLLIVDNNIYLSCEVLMKSRLIDFPFTLNESNILILDNDSVVNMSKTNKITTYYIYTNGKIKATELDKNVEVRKFSYKIDDYTMVSHNGSIGFVLKEDIIPYKVLGQIELDKAIRNEPICLAWDLVAAKEMFREFYIPSSVDVIAPTWYNLIEKRHKSKEIICSKIIKSDSNNKTVEYIQAIADDFDNDKNASRDYFYDVADNDYIDYIHNNGKEIWATFNNSFDKELTRKLLHEGITRSNIVDEIINISLYEGYDGINIDFENVYMTERDVYSAFIKELYCKANKYDIVISVDVAVLSDSETWSRFADRYQIGKYTDYIILMAYDQHVSGTPGSVADIPWIEYGVENLLQSVDSEKVIMAMPFYTRFWEYLSNGTIKSNALKLQTANNVIDKYNIEFVYDEVLGQNYYEGYIDGNLCKMWNEDEVSLNNRLNIYRKYDLAGVGIWALDFGIEAMWNLIEK